MTTEKELEIVEVLTNLVMLDLVKMPRLHCKQILKQLI
jgi:hypothetical protein